MSCASSGLEVLPITLNPGIQRLQLQNNKIRAVDAALGFYAQLQYVHRRIWAIYINSLPSPFPFRASFYFFLPFIKCPSRNLGYYFHSGLLLPTIFPFFRFLFFFRFTFYKNHYRNMQSHFRSYLS